MKDTPLMNGASKRLHKLTEQAEAITHDLGEVINLEGIPAHIIAMLETIRTQGTVLVEDLRNAETLSTRENWRYLARADKAFAYEYLKNAEAATLRAAFKQLPPEIRQRLREDLEEAEHE